MDFILIQNNQTYYKVPAIGLEWKSLGLKPFIANKEGIKSGSDVKEFYLEEQDFIKYSNSIMQNSHKKDNNKVIVAGLGIESILIRVKTEGFSPEILTMYQLVMSQIQLVYFDSNFKEYIKLFQCSPRVKYFLLRAVICKTLAQKMGWTSKKIQDDVLMASLFCDLGAEMDKNPGIYHGEYLSEVMSRNQKISDAVIQGIKHHHEYNDGTGPLRLSRFQINPVAKIIRTVEDVLEFLQKKQDLHGTFPTLFKNKLDSNIVDYCLDIFKKN